ncbi:OmpA family protein [Adhaeribacter aquaticus]|uniref:OmpA family protein n=1 Tax=Adhaeribacter aquaticus TaxID=299567 RepID=UPI00047C11EA|nr:OmpA family protein [Adhaeribacter aquaticus]
MSNFSSKFSKTHLLIILALLISWSASAQSNRQLLRRGNKFFNNEAYRSAIPFYEQILAKDPDNASALYRAGVSYISYDKEKASDYIYRAQRIKPKVAKDIEYWLGRVDHLNYRFDDAIAHYRIYDATLKAKDARKPEIANLIRASRNAKIIFNNPKDIFVKNLGPTVNTAYSEHSPVISKDDNYLLFTSRGENVTGGKEDQFGEYFEDIFETTRTGPDAFNQPKPVGNINYKFHDAAIQLFDNDTKLLLYRDTNNGDFYVAERQADGSWSEPKSIGSNINTSGFESDAYITPDNQRLYFSTSFYSQNGDKDIYVSQRDKNGNWGKPKNIGNGINTREDDDSPYFTPDGKTMYFTSRGHNTMGGFDVFVTHYDSVAHRWTRPENMGYPINTPDDDAYYRLHPTGAYAYLSSYRMGGFGEKDIWTINFIKDVTIKGHVYSLRDSSLIPGVELVFSSQQADRTPISYRDVTKPDSGSYQVNVLSGRKYQVAVSKDGNSIANEEFDIPVVTTEDNVIEKDFYVPFEDASMISRTRFKKIYFDTDEYNLRPESIRELDNVLQVLKANPQINISIDGHCDSRNTDSYNMTLGDNRAKAAYQYLVKNGISPTRLITVSYGERRPAAPNDTPENMQLNRRTEFTIIPRAGETAK